MAPNQTVSSARHYAMLNIWEQQHNHLNEVTVTELTDTDNKHEQTRADVNDSDWLTNIVS